jgi:hypothetical protein
MNIFIILVFIGIAISIYFIQKVNHEAKINEQIRSIGGSVISFESRTFNTGPFLFVGKGRTVYRIEYQVGDEIKEGWVRFGGLFGPDWRL